MIQYLQNLGNSVGLIVKKPIREILGWDKNTALDVSVKGQSLIVTKADAKGKK
jgi:antitoxin component of MazEF toxin-antitoxin module